MAIYSAFPMVFRSDVKLPEDTECTPIHAVSTNCISGASESKNQTAVCERQPAFSLTSGLYCNRKSMVWKTFLTELIRRLLDPLKIIKTARDKLDKSFPKTTCRIQLMSKV